MFESSGLFELSEGGSVAVSGKVRLAEEPDKEVLSLAAPKPNAEKEKLLPLNTNDVYKELRLRGYDYSGLFQGIVSADNRGTIKSGILPRSYICNLDLTINNIQS